MFSKLKQFKDLRDKAKIMQDALAQESTEVETRGIKIKITGNMEIVSISIPDGMAKESLEKNMTDAVNEAIKKAQRIMAKKMQEMGGFSGLGDLQ